MAGRKKKFYFGNCGNAIAENVKKKKKIVLAIVAMALPKMLKKKICFGNCGNAIAENGKKKICFGNCDNAIAENVKKKKIVLAIVAMALLKM